MASKKPRKSESLRILGQQTSAEGEKDTTTIAATFGGFVAQYNEDGKGTLKALAGSKGRQPHDQSRNAQKFVYPEPTTWEESYDYKYPGCKAPSAPSISGDQEQPDSDESIYSPDTMLARFKHSEPQESEKSIDPSLIDPRLLEMSDQPTGARSQSFQSGISGDKQKVDKAAGNKPNGNADNATTCD